jgi:hypothetical protein
MQHFYLWQNFAFVQSWILANNIVNNGNFVDVANNIKTNSTKLSTLLSTIKIIITRR